MLAGVALVLTALGATGNQFAYARENTATVRVTTGATQFKDWERPLVQGNPNLSHFTWLPVTGYSQGRQIVTRKKGPDSFLNVPVVNRKPIYTKPIAVPPGSVADRRPYTSVAPAIKIPTERRFSTNVAPAIKIPTERRFSTNVAPAIKIPTVTARRVPQDGDRADVNGALRVPPAGTQDVSGKLAEPLQDDRAVTARRMETYPAVPRSLFGIPRSNKVQGQIVDQSVHGRLYGSPHEKMLQGQTVKQSVHGRVKTPPAGRSNIGSD